MCIPHGGSRITRTAKLAQAHPAHFVGFILMENKVGWINDGRIKMNRTAVVALTLALSGCANSSAIDTSSEISIYRRTLHEGDTGQGGVTDRDIRRLVIGVFDSPTPGNYCTQAGKPVACR